MKNWFEVDKAGLGKLLERRGKEFAIAELISNAWDQDSTEVVVTLDPAEKRGTYNLVVSDDDPDGFKDLAHAYTLFAESSKKDHAEKRGRFNLGEKLVLALCEAASIISTKGAVGFSPAGRFTLMERQAHGSTFRGVLRMTKDEYETCVSFVRTLIPPAHIRTVFNGQALQARQTKGSFRLALDTHIADADGILRRSVRQATVEIFEPLADEIPSLYEMGIPVVETGDRWHVNVHQKLPLSFERDNVPPAFLRKLRAEVLNQLYKDVTGEDASKSWVKQATESPNASPEAVKHILTETFGAKHVIYDPSDAEANKLAVSQGYSLIYPRSLSAGQWDHVRDHQLALPAGRVTPSPKAVFGNADEGESSIFLSPDKWTDGMKTVANFCLMAAPRLGVGEISVRFTSNITANFSACYGKKELIFAVGRLGYAWFNHGITDRVLDLIIHELGHEFSADHLSTAYHDALTRLGGKMTMLALDAPDMFRIARAEELR